MDLLIFSSMCSELEKIAVKTTEVKQAIKKIRNLTVSSGAEQLSPGQAQLPRRVANEFARQGQASSRKKLDTVEPLAKFFGLEELVDKQRTNLDSQLKQYDRYRRKLGPASSSIEVNPRTSNLLFSNLSKTPISTAKRNEEALAGLVALHEATERKAKIRGTRMTRRKAGKTPLSDKPFYSHAGPYVLVQEMNAVNNLTGPGAQYARSVLQGAREATGEYDHIRSLVELALGKEALQFLKPGQKLNKGMRKALNRAVQEDPTLIDRALKASKKKRGFFGEISRKRELAKRESDAGYSILGFANATLRGKGRTKGSLNIQNPPAEKYLERLRKAEEKRERAQAQLEKTSGIAVKTDPAKWEQAKRDAKARMGGKHSARAMQLATQLYKKRGGGYSGKKPTSKNNSLKKWGKQKWRWSGEKKASEGKGVYLPSAKIDRLKSTPEGRKRLAAAVRKKTEATRKGQQYSSHGLAAGTSLKRKK